MRTTAGAGLGLLLLAATPALPLSTGAQQPSSVQGVVRNETGRPIEQAQVILNPGAGQRELRTDADGRFQFVGVTPGSHRLRVARIGFQPDSQVIQAGGPFLGIAVVLRRLTTLQEVAIQVRPTGVYGTVLSGDQLKPVEGARVELLGARVRDTTDADGAFSMSAAPTGTFMLRVSSAGHDTRMLSVRVPRDTGVGIDLVLRPGSDKLDAHMEMLWADLAQRINWRGVNSAVVGREQLLSRGRSLEMALKFAPDFATKSIVIDEGACLFVDGVARPGATVRDFDTEDIESIEVYASRSEFSNTLGRRWPRGAICGNPGTGPRAAFRRGQSPASRANRAQLVSIWLRK
ncbi:MAG TPA: carboxypeptidase regulatory-like domain-containing protein [Gemmatimonadaceae bacterium]